MATTNATGSTEGVKKLLGESVEESRLKRVEKQNARYRDRGGIFVPADTNPLLDVLLARGVNGESPTKLANAPRSRTSSPSRKKAKAGTESPSKAAKRAVDTKVVNDKGTAKRKAARSKRTAPNAKTPKSSKRAKTGKQRDDAAEEEPIAGPSTRKNVVTQKAKLTARRTKAKAPAPDSPVEDSDDDIPLCRLQARKKPAQQAKGRIAAKSTKPAVREHNQHEQEEEDACPVDTVVQKGTVKKAKATAKAPKSSLDTKATHEVEGDASKNERTPKKKGRIKQRGKTPPETFAHPAKTLPSSFAMEKETSRPQTAKRLHSPDSTESGRDRKRPLPAIGSDHGAEELVNVHPPPKRKRPRLPTPSDSEDDVPVVVRKMAKRVGTAATATNSTAATDRTAATSAKVERPKAYAISKASTSTTLKRKADTATTAAEASDALKMRRIDTSIQDSNGANHKAQAKGGPMEKEAPGQMLTDAAVMDVSLTREDQTAHASGTELREAEQPKFRTEKSVKQGRKRDANKPGKPSKQTMRVSKRKKPASVESEVKEEGSDQVYTEATQTRAVSDRKENRGKSKKVVAPRRAKPRLSLFPTPAMALDSDDEIDCFK
ncbi:hypothetical protein BC835DRAFT_1416619 [Cytidiella melzeri]|nr:hypothetical protein BC835DRAFT_1416619 [Cytidiella melzeri]